MTEEFDKEIDALLRRTANGETAPGAANSRFQIPSSKSVHLDADEIAAFAENALPEKTRLDYTAHFADCDRCRTILSNIISLNAETEAVSASSSVSPKIVETTQIPWYRRILAFPNLAYTFGALVVLLGGFLAFSILQNGNNSRNAEVSQISENQPTASGPSAVIEPDFSTSGTMSNTNMNTANTNTAAMSANSAAISLSNASTATTANNTRQMSNTNSSASNAASVKKEETLNEAKREAEKALTENDAAMRLTGTTADGAAGNQTVNNKQAAEAPEDDEKLKVSPAAPSDARLARPAVADKADNKAALAAKKQNAESLKEANKQIGGKTFNRRSGVWYDSAYNGQSTTNVSRGSEEYRKLDSALRSIADNLGGTVVVVWKNRAYRVQ